MVNHRTTPLSKLTVCHQHDLAHHPCKPHSIQSTEPHSPFHGNCEYGSKTFEPTLFWVLHPLGDIMLRYTLVFLVIALVASALGMVSLSGVAMQGARILFFVFVVLLILSVLFGRRGAQL